MKTTPWITPSLAILLLAMASTAWAAPTEKDEIDISNVTPVSSLATSTSIPTHPTNEIIYTYSGPLSAICSESADTTFGTFTFDWADVVQGTTTPGTLSSTISFSTDGNPRLDFTVPSINVPTDGTNGTETVTVTIPNQGPGGCTTLPHILQGHVTVASSSKSFKTSDKVTVKIVLTSGGPPPACLNLTAATSDQNTGDLLSAVAVVTSKSLTKTTNPGTISVDGLVVNNCADSRTFDILVQMANNWDTQPTNNPGNSTFLYNQSGLVDTFLVSGWGTGTKQGEEVCVQNVTLAAGASLLDRVHAQIDTGILYNQLQNYGQTPQDFVFTVGLSTAGTACAGDAVPFTGSGIANLNYTVNKQ